MKIHFCTQCGSDDVQYRTPEGDSYRRYICGACGFIHYQNPNIVAGCLVVHDEKILLCKRSIEPRKGLWTLPAGFMENHETIVEAAERETWEEARAKVEEPQLYTIFNLPHINQVYVMYYGKLLGDKLAFVTIRETLKLYVQDLHSGHLGLHSGDIIRPWVLANPINAQLKNLVSR